jgi:heptosyltransferase-2
MPHHSPPPQNILIRGPNWVGDAVLGVPAIKAVRTLFPDAKITLLVRPWVAGVFGAATFVDTVWSRPKTEGLGGWVQLAKEIRQRDFDLALLLPNSFEAALAAWIGGIPQRIGYATDGRGLLLTRSMRPKADKHHQAQYYLRLVTGLLGSVPDPSISIEATETGRASARRLLQQQGIDPDGGFVVVTPGAAFGSAKRWYEVRFAAVADRLADELGLPVVVVGSESERLIGEKVRDGMKHPAAVLSGQTSLETLVGLLAHASMMITNDSGPMHIASALGVPTIAVFGPTDAEATYPLGPRARVVRHPVQCSPCLLRECPIDHRCMERVTVEEVFEAAMALEITT